MNFLEKKIIEDGNAINSSVLKVDSFLNHQIDCNVMKNIGNYFYDYFKNKNINKVITIESSGIAPALITAMKFNVPLVVCKKSKSIILDNNILTTKVKSFTKNIIYDLVVSEKFIKDTDNILIIDDFLATGEAIFGVVNLIKKTKANIVGVGIVIEKSFQGGKEKLQSAGFDVCSIAKIRNIKCGKVNFIK